MIPFSSGRTLKERYTIRRSLSDQGGMSHVYEAEDETLGRRVCIKQHLLDPTDLASSKKSFEHEAKLLASLDQHPGIVKVYDYFADDDGNYFIVTQ